MRGKEKDPRTFRWCRLGYTMLSPMKMYCSVRGSRFKSPLLFNYIKESWVVKQCSKCDPRLGRFYYSLHYRIRFSSDKIGFELKGGSQNLLAHVPRGRAGRQTLKRYMRARKSVDEIDVSKATLTLCSALKLFLLWRET